RRSSFCSSLHGTAPILPRACWHRLRAGTIRPPALPPATTVLTRLLQAREVGPDLRAGRFNGQTRQARTLFSAGSSEICPYRGLRIVRIYSKFLAQVKNP